MHSTDGVNFLNNTAYVYNQRGWLKNQASSQFSMILSYEDGPGNQFNGNITQQNWGSHSYNYQYDDINRLLSGTSDEGFNEVVSYNEMGNIPVTRSPTGSSTYHYDNGGNHLSSISGALNGSYIYDGDGNVQTDGLKGINIDYNLLNLPQTITKPSTVEKIVNTWLANGTKLRKVVGNLTRDYDDRLSICQA